MNRRNIPYSEQEMAILARLIETHTGNYFSPERYPLLALKLEPLMAEKGFDNYLDLYYYLQYDPSPDRWHLLEKTLAVNETFFWREYEAIEAAVLHIRQKMEQGTHNIRIWHAACATGEEPYTMAISLLEAGCYELGTITIQATDFNQDALAQAQSGFYRQNSFRAIPTEIVKRYFDPLPDTPGGWRYRLKEEIRKQVRFSYHNLVDTTAIRQMEPFDVIFCRNVFIYFSKETIRQVGDALADVLVPGGYLFTAAVESLSKPSEKLQLVTIGKVFAYQRPIE